MKTPEELAREHGNSVDVPRSWDNKYQDAIRDRAEESFLVGWREHEKNMPRPSMCEKHTAMLRIKVPYALLDPANCVFCFVEKQ